MAAVSSSSPSPIRLGDWATTASSRHGRGALLAVGLLPRDRPQPGDAPRSHLGEKLAIQVRCLVAQAGGRADDDYPAVLGGRHLDEAVQDYLVAKLVLGAADDHYRPASARGLGDGLNRWLGLRHVDASLANQALQPADSPSSLRLSLRPPGP